MYPVDITSRLMCGDDDHVLLLKHMLQDAQAMIDRLVDLTRHAHPGIRLNAVWALMVRFILMHF